MSVREGPRLGYSGVKASLARATAHSNAARKECVIYVTMAAADPRPIGDEVVVGVGVGGDRGRQGLPAARQPSDVGTQAVCRCASD